MTTREPTQEVQSQQPQIGEMAPQATPLQQPVQNLSAAEQAAIEAAQRQAQEHDPMYIVRRDLQAQRARLKQYVAKRLQTGAIPPNSELHSLYIEMDSTVLSFMDTMMQVMHATRDQLFQQIVQTDSNAREAFQEVWGRLEDIDDPDTQFTPEDADKFVYVCQAAQRLAEICKGKPGNDQKELDKIVATSKECLEIIEESTLPPDEDEPAQTGMAQA